MKIILKQDVKGLGRKEEIVNASDGYAKNYLIPRGIAVEATVGNVNEAKNKQQAAKDKKQRELEQAKEFAARLENKTVTIKARAGDSGKLFGAISAKILPMQSNRNMMQKWIKRKLCFMNRSKQLGSISLKSGYMRE